MRKVKKKSGRPLGTSKFKEKTVLFRVPLSLAPYVEELLESYVENGFEVTVLLPKSRKKLLISKGA